ncbi:MAG: hypothetical protein Q8M19_27930 [Reyranella sp.]|nr:hypothetical protein [Reyranella sp.]
MRRTVVVALLIAATLPACMPGDIDAQTAGPALGPTVGGVNYAPQYDFSEFWAATDGKAFRVVFAGNPFPALPVEQVKQRLLPVLQANKPRPALTFTYDVPPELPRPDYRLVLVFDPANDLGSGPVCNGVTRFKPGIPGRVYVYGVYCRNDLALSETTAWTQATGPDDPRLGPLFAQLFLVLFTDQPMRRDRFVPFMRW